MYYERYFKQRNGNITREVEKQAELAEWVEVRPRCFFNPGSVQSIVSAQDGNGLRA